MNDCLKEIKNLRVEWADNFFKKAFGYMFRKVDHAIVFPFKKDCFASLHMFFVFESLVALFLDANGRVVEKAILKPFTMYFPKKKCRYVVEVPVKFSCISENEDLSFFVKR